MLGAMANESSISQKSINQKTTKSRNKNHPKVSPLGFPPPHSWWYFWYIHQLWTPHKLLPNFQVAGAVTVVSLPQTSRKFSATNPRPMPRRAQSPSTSGVKIPSSWEGKKGCPKLCPSKKLTFSHLKMDGWNKCCFLLGPLGLFQGRTCC